MKLVYNYMELLIKKHMSEDAIKAKAVVIMNELGQSENISDYELTLGVASRISKFTKELVLADVINWLNRHLKEYILTDIDSKYAGVDGLMTQDLKNYINGK